VPVVIQIKVEDDGAKTMLSTMQSKSVNMRSVMFVIGEIVQASIIRNFEKGGRPTRWKPSKRALATGGKTLVDKGVSGGLMASISYRPFTDKVVISANKVYAAVHQFGIGRRSSLRSRRVMPAIPARPYMLIQDEDWREINDELIEHMKGK
jgi:phage virion morphogenesis protein